MLEPWPLALIASWMPPLPGDTLTVPAPLLAVMGVEFSGVPCWATAGAWSASFTSMLTLFAAVL